MKLKRLTNIIAALAPVLVIWNGRAICSFWLMLTALTSCLGTAQSLADDIWKTGEWPGYARGSAESVVVSADRAYVAAGEAGLMVLDVAHPSSLVRLGGYDTSGYAYGIQVVGTIAYIADGTAGLQILDVSNPANVVRSGDYDTKRTSYGVHVIGTTAYVADGGAGLEILDVRNPANVVRLGGFDTSGYAYGLHVVGTTAYVGDDEAGVRILDVSNPTNVILLGNYVTGGSAHSIQVIGTTAFVAADGAGLQILDVSNPTSVVLFASHGTTGYARWVQVIGGTAYVVDYPAGVQILDVTNPATVRSLGSHASTFGDTQAIHVAGTTAYVAHGTFGLEVLDVSDPAHALQLGGYGDDFGSACDVQVIGTTAYVADGGEGLQILDVSDPANILRMGSYNTPGYARDLQVEGTTAYIVDGIAGVEVLDVSNSANVVRLGGYDTDSYARGIHIVGAQAFVADGYGGLVILDVSNPLNVRRLGGYDTDGYAEAVCVRGTTAYVADWSGVEILDVRNPAAVKRLGLYSDTQCAVGILVIGATAYVADMCGGLTVLDVREPAKVVRLGSYSASTYGVQVLDAVAFVATGRQGLQVLDVSNPAAVAELASYNTRGSAFGVNVVSNTVYVADGSWGISVLASTLLEAPTITVEPVSVNVSTGSTATLNVAATGTPPLVYQWRRDGVDLGNADGLTGANTATLTLTNVRANQAGAYSVVVSNSVGVAASSDALLVVGGPQSSDEEEIRALYAKLESRAAARDVDGFMGCFAADYIHSGSDYASLRESVQSRISTVESLSVSIDRIETAGDQATVYGSCTVAFDDGEPPSTWAEPNTSEGLALGWLRKTAAGWRIIGNQERASVHVQTAGHGSGFGSLSLRAGSDLMIESVTVTGPDIDATPLESNALRGGFQKRVYFRAGTLPQVGTEYLFDVQFADGTHQVLRDVVKSWILIGPDIWVTTGADAATIHWTDVSAQVPNAAHYFVWLGGDGVEWDSEKLPLSRSSIRFNEDGEATGSLQNGSSYFGGVLIFNSSDDYAEETYRFTMEGGAGESPVISGQPQNQTVILGEDVTFSVLASGTEPLAYQWRKNGTNVVNGGNLSGAATATLTLTNVQTASAGLYSVVVRNELGVAVSSNAVLTVQASPQFNKGSLSVSSGSLQMRLDGSPGLEVVVESSLDLTTWTPWQTNTLPAGGLNLAVPLGTNRQFFRARIP